MTSPPLATPPASSACSRSPRIETTNETDNSSSPCSSWRPARARRRPTRARKRRRPWSRRRSCRSTAEHFIETVDAVGTVVAARRARRVARGAVAHARGSKVCVSFGARVKSGDPLVGVRAGGVRRGGEGRRDASLAAAEKAAERTQRLADAGVVPRKDAEAAAADLGAARLNAVNARRARELSTLRAPIDGVVTRMSAVLGASADPTQVMVEVADPTRSTRCSSCRRPTPRA